MDKLLQMEVSPTSKTMQKAANRNNGLHSPRNFMDFSEEVKIPKGVRNLLKALKEFPIPGIWLV
jgi:hypothetical protein